MKTLRTSFLSLSCYTSVFGPLDTETLLSSVTHWKTFKSCHVKVFSRGRMFVKSVPTSISSTHDVNLILPQVSVLCLLFRRSLCNRSLHLLQHRRCRTATRVPVLGAVRGAEQRSGSWCLFTLTRDKSHISVCCDFSNTRVSF